MLSALALPLFCSSSSFVFFYLLPPVGERETPSVCLAGCATSATPLGAVSSKLTTEWRWRYDNEMIIGIEIGSETEHPPGCIMAQESAAV